MAPLYSPVGRTEIADEIKWESTETEHSKKGRQMKQKQHLPQAYK